MKSPAQRHFERVSAATASARVDQGESLAGASVYELMLSKLATDRRRLKELQSQERKIEVKREVLPEYADYIAGVLEGGKGAQDDVLTTVMLWRVDAGDYPGALDIARYALEYGLKMPDQFERSLACVMAEEISEAALAALADGSAFSAEMLAQVGELTDKHDMPDQVRAKLCKAYGRALLVGAGDPSGEDRWKHETALTALKRAVELHDRVGCKPDIAALEKALAASQAGS